MIAEEQPCSDEPTRVEQLVTRFLSKQSGSSFGPGEGDVLLTIGADRRDDCAVYDLAGPVTLVVGSDYVRGPKFVLHEMGLLSDFDIGYYLVAANVSDIAAMGALPIGVLTVVRYPSTLNDASFHQVMAGIHQACSDFGTLNVGGDIGSAERLILSGTALGVCQPGTVLLRSGARVGDLLCLTGPCGLLGAAVAYFPQRAANRWALSPESEGRLLHAWQRPQARVAEGQVLGRERHATSCQDTSDGLKATIEQLMAASGVGFQVAEGDVPIDPEVVEVAGLLGVEPLALAMSASSDFQLAFTVAPHDLGACRKDFDEAGLDFWVIGRAVSGDRADLRDAAGRLRPLPGVAWRHQETDVSSLVPDSG